MFKSRVKNWFPVKGLLGLAFFAFLTANLIHNNLKIDLAVLPSLSLALLFYRYEHKLFAIGSSLMLALPSFMFFKWSALAEPTTNVIFLNHFALLAAGLVSTGCILACLVSFRSLDSSEPTSKALD